MQYRRLPPPRVRALSLILTTFLIGGYAWTRITMPATASGHKPGAPTAHAPSRASALFSDRTGHTGGAGALAPGADTVSGRVTDATTGAPIANANIGISMGRVGSSAQYTKTGADGSYSFSGLASGAYNLAASRYLVSGTQPLYALSTKMGQSVGGSTTVNFALKAIPVAGGRPAMCNRGKNLVVIDYDETYFESFFTDAHSMMNRSPAIHSIAKGGVNATSDWTSYGYSPIDHYQIAVGSYPAWRTPDAPGKVWGQPDGLDTNIWYTNGGASEVFLQESIFDVAKSYGMNTAVIGGNDYPTGHITDANVDLIQLGLSPSSWAPAVENFLNAHASNPNGSVVYMTVTQAEGSSIESTSPDASGSQYQTASAQDDQIVQRLLSWLQSNGYMSSTVVAATADEAENDHTQYDNFYGVGSTGMGTTRHEPFVMEGPGVVHGPFTYSSLMNSDDESTNFMSALHLPAPVDSRGHVIPAFFQTLNCGPGGTPTPTPVNPTATPTPHGPTATPTPIGPPPTPTDTPLPGSNIIVNPGFESGPGVGWSQSPTSANIINTVNPHAGRYSADECGTNNCTEYMQQQITVPSGVNLGYWWYMSSQASTSTPYDYLYVQLYNTNGTLLATLATHNNTNTRNTWTQDTVSLAPYAGKTVLLRFTTKTDYIYPTDFFMDDVAVP